MERLGEVAQPPAGRIQWAYLGRLASLDGNAFKTPVVREVPRPPIEPGPDYDPPQSEALAA